ncbi:MAG: response regulator, partial [Deltaproteobacteria bacterium]|nr:response regulator [Deltaproteobacteria bacterium]
MRYILAVTAEKAQGDIIRTAFRRSFHVDAVSSVPDGLDPTRKRRYDFIFIDLDMTAGARGADGAPLKEVRQAFPSAEVIVMTEPERVREAVEAVKAGAANYVTYPLNPDEIRYVVESIHESIRAESELAYLRDRFWQSDSQEIVQTRSAAMRDVFSQV